MLFLVPGGWGVGLGLCVCLVLFVLKKKCIMSINNIMYVYIISENKKTLANKKTNLLTKLNNTSQGCNWDISSVMCP